jgi:hypothetical protein
MNTEPTKPTEVRRDENRETDDVETAADAPYNRTYSQPAGEEDDNDRPVQTEDEIERTKTPYHGETN